MKTFYFRQGQRTIQRNRDPRGSDQQNVQIENEYRKNDRRVGIDKL